MNKPAAAPGYDSEADGDAAARTGAVPMMCLRLVPYWSVHETLGVDAHNAPLKMRTRRIHLSRAVAWSCVRRHPVAGVALGSTDVEGSDPARGRPGDGVGAYVFSHALPPAGSLPAMDPYGKVIGAMLRPATLVLVGLASAAAIAHAFWAPFPGSGENPVLDFVAYHDPGFHAVIRTWYYAAPAVAVVLAGSLGLSVWRVWLQPRVGSGGRRGSSHQRSCAAARLRLVSVAQSSINCRRRSKRSLRA